MRFLKITALAAALVLVASGCGGGNADAAAQEPSPQPSPAFVVQDPWVKAADKGMTAAFGTFVNNSTADVTVVKAETEVSPMELHEMAMKDGEMTMKPKEGGIVIPAGGTHKLEPGGDHLMMMDLAKPVKAGDEVIFTLTFGDGTTSRFTAVAKPFTGAQESYDPGMTMSS
jgi:copper(I)-binding protein